MGSFTLRSRGQRLLGKVTSGDTSTGLAFYIPASDMTTFDDNEGGRRFRTGDLNGVVMLQKNEDGVIITPFLSGNGDGTAYWNLYVFQAVLKSEKQYHDQVTVDDVVGYFATCVAKGTLTFDQSEDQTVLGNTDLGALNNENALQFPGSATLELTSDATDLPGTGSARFAALATPQVLDPGSGNGLGAQIFVPSFASDVVAFGWQCSTADQNADNNAFYEVILSQE